MALTGAALHHCVPRDDGLERRSVTEGGVRWPLTTGSVKPHWQESQRGQEVSTLPAAVTHKARDHDFKNFEGFWDSYNFRALIIFVSLFSQGD